MKHIQTNGISYIEPLPGVGTAWYYGISREHGDLYEAEELFLDGHPLQGNKLCLIHYPDGEVFTPLPREEGKYSDTPVFWDGSIFFLNVDFPRGVIRIFRFDCETHGADIFKEIPLASVKNCYNLMLHTAPLSLTRQGNDGLFEILWPERTSFPMDPHESFFLRDGERLFFSKWYEEGEGAQYRYWEETVVRDPEGNLLEVLPGDVRLMPDGELWHID